MHDAEGGGRLERAENLHRIVAGDADAELLLALESTRDRFAFEQLHDDVRDAVVRSLHVHHLDDVGALDLSRDTRLAKEAFDQACPTREVGVQHLDGHARPEPLVMRFEDRSHSAIAEKAHEAVLSADEVTLLHGERLSLPSDAPACASPSPRLPPVALVFAFEPDVRLAWLVAGFDVHHTRA